MSAVILSSKYQVVIPKEVRESTGLEAGTPFEIIAYNGRIELIPLRPISDLKGFLKGIDTVIEREEDRR
jgi:AbrB family looped-hinge helix DNA binding protein